MQTQSAPNRSKWMTLNARLLIPALIAAASSLAAATSVSLHTRAQPYQEPESRDAASGEDAQDAGWPRQFETQTHTVRIHQPQVDSWPNFDRLHFRAAVVVAPKGEDDQKFGIVTMSGSASVSFEQRLVMLTDRTIESIAFPGIDAAEAEKLSAIVRSAMPPERPQTISLDRIVAEVPADTTGIRKIELNLAPPKIIASDKPAVMVIFHGTPRFRPIPGNDLLAASNTNWDVFLDPATSTYFLLHDGSWMTTTDLANGPWHSAAALPKGLSSLPPDENWSEVRASVPGIQKVPTPTVFVSFEPAELIVTEGAAEMEPIPGTKLFLVVNTESDLFYSSIDKRYFLLSAGRWFAAADLSGPWASASSNLPDDFRLIPESSPAGAVLASVPGTPAAAEAMVMASIPNRATVNKADVSLTVTYDGEPDFRVIETTTVRYAHNSPFNVFLVDGMYYCCHNAVWFVAPKPGGLWTVADSVPAAIYTIPPTSPKHNVTYVYVYSSTPTTVSTGYTAGYSGAHVAATGAVMFGLGVIVGAAADDCCWHYHYHSGFFSYGCGAIWHHSGGFVCGGFRYGPYGGAGSVGWYNPHTGTWNRGGYAYGPHGAAGYRTAYNPATGNSGFRAAGVTPHGSWSRGAVSNGDDWVRWGSRSNSRGTVSGIQGSDGGAAIHAEGRFGNGVTVVRSEDGDIYAGKDGNIYKKSGDDWHQSRNSSRPDSTSAAPSPASASTFRTPPKEAGDLNGTASARDRGNRNANRSFTPKGEKGSTNRGRGTGRR